MEEENHQQVKQEPQQVTTKEPQRVTTKDPKKVEAGKRLATISHKKREAKKREEQAQMEKTRMNQYYGMGSHTRRAHWGCYSSGSDSWSWFLHLSVQERRAGRRATFNEMIPLTLKALGWGVFSTPMRFLADNF